MLASAHTMQETITASAKTPVLSLEQVHRSFPATGNPVSVLRGATLSIYPSDFIILNGPSGSGKTTLLHIAALLDQPTSGILRFQGSEITSLPEVDRCELRKQGISIVFQKFCLLPHRTALDNVLFRFRYMKNPPRDSRERSLHALTQMGLASMADRKASLLSSGEMQRTAIARAIVHPPALLLADEPTGNLDPESAATVMECFQTLHRQGMTILMVTHNTSLLPYATRCYVCQNGILKEHSS